VVRRAARRIAIVQITAAATTIIIAIIEIAIAIQPMVQQAR
jgi:hypothetical protein